jgi:Domain of unknown function (DUF3846)
MAIVIPPSGVRYEQLPANGRTFELPELQALVGGYLEALRIGDGRWLFINEDGKGLDLPVNPAATALMRQRIFPEDYIVGTAVVCSPLEAGEGEP